MLYLYLLRHGPPALIISVMLMLESGFQLVKDEEVEEYLEQVARRYPEEAGLSGRRFDVGVADLELQGAAGPGAAGQADAGRRQAAGG